MVSVSVLFIQSNRCKDACTTPCVNVLHITCPLLQRSFPRISLQNESKNASVRKKRLKGLLRMVWTHSIWKLETEVIFECQQSGNYLEF